MADRMGVLLDFLRCEGRFCLPERIEHELLNRHPIALAGGDLDQPSEQDEPGVVVTEKSPEGGHLRVSRKALCDETGDGVVAVAGIDGVIGPPSAGMGQQVPYRQPGGDILVHEPKVRQVVADRRVEVELAHIDQAHDRHAGIGLDQRADLETGVGGDRCLRRKAGDTKDCVLLPTIGQDAERGTRHLVLGHRRQQSLRDSAEAGRGVRRNSMRHCRCLKGVGGSAAPRSGKHCAAGDSRKAREQLASGEAIRGVQAVRWVPIHVCFLGFSLV
jgi:hypothetical protein